MSKIIVAEFSGAYADKLVVLAQTRIADFIKEKDIHWVESCKIEGSKEDAFKVSVEGEWTLPDANVKDIFYDVLDGKTVDLEKRLDYTDEIAKPKPTLINPCAEIPIPVAVEKTLKGFIEVPGNKKNRYIVGTLPDACLVETDDEHLHFVVRRAEDKDFGGEEYGN